MLTEGKVVKMASLKLFLECIVGNVSKVEYIMKKFSFFKERKIAIYGETHIFIVFSCFVVY